MVKKGSALQYVQERLKAKGFDQRSETEWRCAHHEDNEASVTVKYGTKKPDKVLLKCAVCGGADNAEFMEFIGLSKSDLVDRAARGKPSSRVKNGKLIKTDHHPYQDENGDDLYRVVKKRYENRTITWQEPWDGKRWVKKSKANPSPMEGVRRVLYRLPELLKAIADGCTIHLTEGESDADALNEYFKEHDENGFATCHPGGARKWATYDEAGFLESLAGASEVVVWADRDAAGYRCALQRLKSVQKASLSARAVLPAIKDEHADARDHLAADLSPHEAKPVKKKKLRALASSSAPRASLDYPQQTWDDFGNAQRFVDRYADRVRWVADNETWAVYNPDTGLWSVRGVDDRAGGLARKTIERAELEEAGAYSTEIGSGSDGKRRQSDEWRKWIKGQRSTGKVNSLLNQAKTKKPIKARLADFDAKPNLLHCTNGVLDLNTLELLPFSPDHLCTISTGTRYEPGARHDLWSSYLDLFLPDKALRQYVQRLLGYTLLDGNPERKFVFVKGATSSGKSTLNEVMLATLGDYARPFNLTVLRANQDEKPRADVAGVLHRRYIAAVEASPAWNLHADQIKKVVGGDKVAARFPYDRADTVRVPAFVPFIFTNAVPTIAARDRALDRRLVVLPFEHEVSTKDEKRGAREEMVASADVQSAVLAWLIEGLKVYKAKEGLGREPKIARRALVEAQGEFSDFDRWLHDRCEFGKPDDPDFYSVPSDLHGAYRSWCYGNHFQDSQILNDTKFGTELTNRGHVRHRHQVAGDRYWVRVGLRLKDKDVLDQ